MNAVVVIDPYFSSFREFICECGYNHETHIKGDFVCPNCGADKIKIKLEREYRTKTINHDFYVVDKGLKHFHIARDREKIIFKKDKSFYIKQLEREEFKVNLKDKTIKLIRGKEEKLLNDLNSDEKLVGRRIDSILKGVGSKKLIDLISTPENYELLSFAYKNLSRDDWRSSFSFGRGLYKLLRLPFYEVLYFSGLNTRNLLIDFKRNQYHLRRTETKPHKILNVPKVMIPFIKNANAYDPYVLKDLNDLHNTVGGNNFKTIIDILQEETDMRFAISTFATHVTTLYSEYGYKNIKRLIEYLARDVKLNQGIENPNTASIHLVDYIKIMKEMEYRYEKYPKSLKKDHDIASLNYKIMENNIVKEKLREKVESEDYKSLEFKNKEYSIIAPSKPDDIVQEGQSLSHCVASYVKDVSKGLCKILFLRNTNELDKSVVTIEVRGDKVRQARGSSNRDTTENENEFIKKWAEKRNLKLAY